jgi:hypothetical protein
MQVRRGTASSWTSTNPTLAAGELGFETDTGKFKIGTGASTWTSLPYAGGGQNTLTTYQYTATAGQTTFSGADSESNTLSYTAGAVQVYLNGALLANTTDYAASTGTSVVLTAGAGLGDSLTILSLGSFTVSTDIPKSTLTAKGSIIAASGAATPANLSVGANDTVLTADSTTATGLKWATPAAAVESYALVNAGGTTLTSVNTVTISGISGKKGLFIYLENAGRSSGNQVINLRFNGDTGNNYQWMGFQRSAGSAVTTTRSGDTSSIDLVTPGGTANGWAVIQVRGCDGTGFKPITFDSATSDPTTAPAVVNGGSGYYKGTSAISSVTIFGLNNFTQGTVFVYAA